MNYPVIKAAAYAMIHTPDILKRYGSTTAALRRQNADDPILTDIAKGLRDFDRVVDYPPNQVYIGNMSPAELAATPQPWHEQAAKGGRFGKFGEIMPQDEFYLLLKFVDAFDLVWLDSDFLNGMKEKAAAHPILSKLAIAFDNGQSLAEIEKLTAGHSAEPLTIDDKLVGCVKQAHDSDENLNGHIMLENLCMKASAVLSGLLLAEQSGVNPADVDYLIECSEEACGDVNQRGGGNFAKAIGESIGCRQATGIDVRGFCAAPAHAMVNAAALVKSGVFKNVLVIAGGAVAKLAMNGRDHVKKELPVLEDSLAGFAFLVSENDGKSPQINTDIIGRHKIGTGSSPQAVMTSLIYDPLENAGLRIDSVDKYSVEMQNPEITKPAGAGDVPEANYKMIGALAVMKKQMEKSELTAFIAKHGMPGFALTQGHIPSGVPYIGHALREMEQGQLNRTMIVGKGSLFLGRMTNLFDGISFVIEKNSGESGEESFDEAAVRAMIADAMREVAQKLAAE